MRSDRANEMPKLRHGLRTHRIIAFPSAPHLQHHPSNDRLGFIGFPIPLPRFGAAVRVYARRQGAYLTDANRCEASILAILARALSNTAP